MHNIAQNIYYIHKLVISLRNDKIGVKIRIQSLFLNNYQMLYHSRLSQLTRIYTRINFTDFALKDHLETQCSGCTNAMNAK